MEWYFLKARDSSSDNFSWGALPLFPKRSPDAGRKYSFFFCSHTPECYLQNVHEMTTENRFSLPAVLCYSPVEPEKAPEKKIITAYPGVL